MKEMRSSPVDSPTTLELLAALICENAHARFLRVDRTKGHAPQIIFTAANATNEAPTFALSVTDLSAREIRMCLGTIRLETESLKDKQQEVSPEQECKIPAEKPSSFETSPAGAPILTGDGLRSVRERIEAEFAKATTLGPTSLVPPKPVPEHLRAQQAAVAPPRRPLVEIAAPVLRVAEKHFQDVGAQHPHHQGAYVVTAPKESAEKLFERALRVLRNIPLKKEKRYEVEGH